MNKDELKGKIENLKGRAKEAFGAVTGSKSTEAEGAVERGKGAAEEKYGEVKDELAGERRSADADVEEERGPEDDPAVRPDDEDQ